MQRAAALEPELKKPNWMVGDHPGADFLNTIDARGYPNEIDHLRDYDDLLRWVVRAGLMREGDVRPLRSRAAASGAARTVLGEVKALREAAHEIVMAADHGDAPPMGGAAIVKRAILAASESRSLVWTDRGLVQKALRADDLRQPLHAIALQLKELFAPGNFERVHVCSGDDCDWAFLDRSPTQRRRWCHMSACGNRAKVRGLRARRRKALRK
jgi:predicted RNA-binding Zn ribbon-like protein